MPNSSPTTTIATPLIADPFANDHRQDADRRAAERREHQHEQRGPGLAVARQRIAVQAGYGVRRGTRQVQHDGGDAAAILRAVVDAGQHDQRRGRRHGVRQRQQDGNGGQHAHARQYADQVAHEHAKHGPHQVVQRERDRKPVHQIIEDFHRSAPAEQRKLQLQRPREHGHAQDRHAHGKQGGAAPRVLTVAHRRNERQAEGGRHQAAELADQDEGQQAANDAAPAAPFGRRNLFGVFFGRGRGCGHLGDDQSQHHQQGAQNRREHARPHARKAA
ncbi:hypothetical protein G6F22_015362 [Rhizopus arrhizus]|nr:hypothetical protein G6F22_015362 [Rhizopus arrhizus]